MTLCSFAEAHNSGPHHTGRRTHGGSLRRALAAALDAARSAATQYGNSGPGGAVEANWALHAQSPLRASQSKGGVVNLSLTPDHSSPGQAMQRAVLEAICETLHNNRVSSARDLDHLHLALPRVSEWV